MKKGKEALEVIQGQWVHQVQLERGVLLGTVVFQVLMACLDQRVPKESVVQQVLLVLKEVREILGVLVSLDSQVQGV